MYDTFLNGRVSIIHQSNACTVQSVTELIHQYWGDRLDISLLWKRSSAFQCIKKFKTVLSSDFSYIAMLEVFNAIWPNWYAVAFFINIFWNQNFSLIIEIFSFLFVKELYSYDVENNIFMRLDKNCFISYYDSKQMNTTTHYQDLKQKVVFSNGV